MTGDLDGSGVRGRTVLVLGVAALLACLAVALGGPFLRHPALLGTVSLPWWGLALATVVSDSCLLFLRGRRDSRVEVSLTYFPLVLGLFFTAPWQLLAGRLAGAVVVSASRRQKAIKMVVNLSIVAAETVVAGVVFRGLGPDGGLGPATWLAALLATAMAFWVGAIAVELVVLLYRDRRARWRRTAAEWWQAVGLRAEQTLRVALVATFALLAVTALDGSVQTVWLLVACGLMLAWGYRRHARLHDHYLDLKQLQGGPNASPEQEPEPRSALELGGVLRRTQELLWCARAELVVLGESGASHLRLGPEGELVREPLVAGSATDVLLRRVLDGAAPIVLGRTGRDPAARLWLEAERVREAVAVPLRDGQRVTGMLVAADRRRDREAAAFLAHDVSLLETLADDACASLRVGQLIDRLQHEALHDPLTGLPNRAHLQRRLDAATVRVRSGATPSAAVMILDLNGFKQVNDRLGHAEGDRLLVQLAAQLAATAEATTLVARLGGDEFAVLLEHGPGAAEARALARRLVSAVSEPVDLGGHVVTVGASVGVALAPAHALEPKQLLKCADVAMYHAKASGAPVCVYDPQLDGSRVG